VAARSSGFPRALNQAFFWKSPPSSNGSLPELSSTVDWSAVQRRHRLIRWKCYLLAGFYAFALLLTTVESFALNTVKTKSGTIVVFGVSKNKIVVAADSRSSGRNAAGDHQCKIITLNDRTAFSSNGLAAFPRSALLRCLKSRPVAMAGDSAWERFGTSFPSGSRRT
jgi:hypothetical protein